MDKARIKLELAHMSVADQIALGRRIVAGLTNSDLSDKAALAARITTATDAL